MFASVGWWRASWALIFISVGVPFMDARLNCKFMNIFSDLTKNDLLNLNDLGPTKTHSRQRVIHGPYWIKNSQPIKVTLKWTNMTSGKHVGILPNFFKPKMTFWPNPTRTFLEPKSIHGASVYVMSKVKELSRWPWNDLGWPPVNFLTIFGIRPQMTF